LEKIINTINMTVPIDSDMDAMFYQSNNEIIACYNIAIKNNDKKIMDFLMKKCELYEHNELESHISMYILLLTGIASWYGNDRKYDISDEISKKIIDISVKTYRISGLYNSLYNIVWNDAVKTKKYNCAQDVLKDCILLCDFYDNQQYKRIFEEKMRKSKSGIDWTS